MTANPASSPREPPRKPDGQRPAATSEPVRPDGRRSLHDRQRELVRASLIARSPIESSTHHHWA